MAARGTAKEHGWQLKEAKAPHTAAAGHRGMARLPYVDPCGNTASRAELATGSPVEQGSGAWAGPIGDADSRGEC
jgi:hypothetical protein